MGGFLDHDRVLLCLKTSMALSSSSHLSMASFASDLSTAPLLSRCPWFFPICITQVLMFFSFRSDPCHLCFLSISSMFPSASHVVSVFFPFVCASFRFISWQLLRHFRPCNPFCYFVVLEIVRRIYGLNFTQFLANTN